MARDLDWDGCFNIRDLGGVEIATGATTPRVFVRGDNARTLTAYGWRQAADYGITTVLDLRSEPECVNDPPAALGFSHRRLSLFDHYDGDPAYRADLNARVAESSMAEKYRAFYTEALDLDSTRFAEATGILAGGNGGVLFHCVGGKDRTGVLAALLLRLAGASLEAVETDYRRTEERAVGTVARSLDRSAPADVIPHVLRELEAQYGSVAGYLLAAGVPATALDDITSKLAPER